MRAAQLLGMIQPSIFVEPHTAELPLELVVEIVCVLQHPTQGVAELVIIEKVAEQCVLEEDARAVLVIGHKCERSEPMIAGAERDMPMQLGVSGTCCSSGTVIRTNVGGSR